MTLSLERTPARDVIHGTAMAWREAVTEGREFDQSRDLPRFREAFRRLSRDCTAWPVPRQFLEALPALESEARVPRIEDEARRLRGLAHIEDIMRQMVWDREGDHATDAAA